MADEPKINAEPTTVAELLTRSLSAPLSPRMRGSNNQVAAFASADPDFSPFLIRVRHEATRPGELKAMLNSTTALTPPSLLFCGPRTSQPLLQLDNGPNSTQQLEIIVKHEGQSVACYLNGGKSQAELIEEAWAHQGEDREAWQREQLQQKQARQQQLMQKLLDHPEYLDTLFEQAALIGYQPSSPERPDFNPANIMVEEDGRLSIIDAVCNESLPREHTDSIFLQEKVMHYIGDVRAEMGEHLTGIPKDVLRSRATSIGMASDPVAQAFMMRLDESFARYKQKVETGALREEIRAHRPGWVGFQHPTLDADGKLVFAPAEGHLQSDHDGITAKSVVAVKLSDPPWKLKNALQELYAVAVPEAARA